MKKSMYNKSVAIFLMFAILFSSCESAKNANNTQKGAAGGAVAGALLGGILGNNIGGKNNSALGAILGAVVGGVAGGLIGKKMDNQAKDIQTSLPGAKVERVGEGIRLILDENAINFDYAKANLTEKAKTNLNKLIPVFKKYPDTNINIAGYTDGKGSDEYNLKLSEQRAAEVQNFLLNNGISTDRITTIGKGETEPIAENETEEGRAKNRRVEFVITANEKMIKEAKEESK